MAATSLELRPFRSLASRLIRRIALLALLCLLLIGGLHAVLDYRASLANFRSLMHVIGTTSVPPLSAALWDVEPELVREQVERLAALPEVAHVRVSMALDDPIQAGRIAIDTAEAPVVSLPIGPPPGLGGAPLGLLDIWGDTRHFGEVALRRSARIVAGYALFIAIVCAIVAWVLRRELQVPLQQIARFAAQLQPNELARPLTLERRGRHSVDEIDLVSQGFRQLQHDLSGHIDRLDLLVAERTEQLAGALDEVKRLSLTDTLTGCPNRRSLDERLPRELERCRRYRRSLSVIFTDVDHFKRVNDTLGHVAGDQVLREVAARLREQLRERIDWMARYGGEEFIIVLPETRLPAALRIADRLRHLVRNRPIDAEGGQVFVTSSFGVAEYLGPDETADQLLARADAMLYQAKAEGRDRVCPTG
ncbi:MAG: diguanylate cyclase [Burkholderiaceae bacterium]